MSKKTVATAENVNVHEPATISTKIVGVRCYRSIDDAIKYRVQFKDMFDGFVKNDDGEYVEGSVDYLDVVPRYFIAVCLDNIEGLSIMYDKKQENGLRNGTDGFGKAELNVVLRDATIELVRTRFNVGDEYTDKDGNVQTHDHDGYDTEIKSIKVIDRVQRKLDGLFDKMFDI